MTTTTADSAELRTDLVNRLEIDGYLHEPRWREAFHTIPRETFVHRFDLHDPTTGTYTHHDLNTSPETALPAIYSNASLLTQFDAAGTATSSSTTPSLMALMLERLDAHPGHRVLEIGTGTGYNAALLCHTLGDHAVTSIDIDPDLVDHARTRLNSLGHAPTLISGDGSKGAPDHGPYDRIIATCGLPRIPADWLKQVRPGGIILANLGFALARLNVSNDGTAAGRFTDYAAFMQLRKNLDDTHLSFRDIIAASNRDGTTYRSTTPTTLSDRAFDCLHAIVHPTVQRAVIHTDDGDVHAFVDTTTGSWARARIEHDGAATVVHGGTVDPWDDLNRLAAWWDDHGRPDPTQLGITVTASGDHLLWQADPDTAVKRLAG